MSTFRPFIGSPEVSAAHQPFVGTAPLCDQGIFLGRNLRTHKVERFDPWEMKRRGLIDSTVCLVTGTKGSGKSTWGKSVVPRLMARQAGLRPDGSPEQMRVWMHSRKPEAGVAEIVPLAGFLATEMTPLRRKRSINIFDTLMGMTEWNLLEVAVNTCELADGHELRDFQPLALQVAMHKMLRESRSVSSLELLALILRGLDKGDVDDYFDAADNEILSSYAQQFGSQPELQRQLQLYTSRPHNVPEAAFRQDAALVASSLMRVYSGDFGGIFGGTGSVRPLLSQPLLCLDWSDVNRMARSLLDAMLWKWQTIALNNNDLEVIPHINLGDEEHEAMADLMHVRFRAAYAKKARALHTFDVQLTQYETDISRAGDADSTIRSLGEAIALSVGFRILFRQPDDPKIKQHLSGLGISDRDVDFLCSDAMGIPGPENDQPRIAGVKLPGRPITFYAHELAPSEFALMGTDSASARMMERARLNGAAADDPTGNRLNGHSYLQTGVRP